MLFIILKIKMYFGTADYKALFKIDFIGLWFISVLNHGGDRENFGSSLHWDNIKCNQEVFVVFSVAWKISSSPNPLPKNTKLFYRNQLFSWIYKLAENPVFHQ